MASVTKRIWTHNGIERMAWVLRYREGGKHRSRQFKTKKEADAAERKVLREIEDGVHVAKSSDRTVASIIDLYAEELEGQVLTGAIRRGTRAERLYRLRSRALAEFGHVNVQNLTADMAVAWHRKLIGSGLDQGTAVNYLQLACQLLDFAIKRGWLRVNVFRAVRKGLRVPKKRIETFTPDEVRHLLRLVADRPARARRRGQAMLECAVNMAACCGMRWGEIFALRLSDVDLATGLVTIRQGIDRWGDLGRTKSDYSVRDLFLPEHIRAMLATYIAEHPSGDSEGVIFTRSTRAADGTMAGKARPSKKVDRADRAAANAAGGTRFDNSNFQENYWKPLLVRAGFPPVEQRMPGGRMRRSWRHFHALRHFAASFMIDSDWTIPEVQQQLGHSNPAITLRIYSHVIRSKEQTSRATQSLAHKLLAEPSAAIPTYANCSSALAG